MFMSAVNLGLAFAVPGHCRFTVLGLCVEGLESVVGLLG